MPFVDLEAKHMTCQSCRAATSREQLPAEVFHRCRASVFSLSFSISPPPELQFLFSLSLVNLIAFSPVFYNARQHQVQARGLGRDHNLVLTLILFHRFPVPLISELASRGFDCRTLEHIGFL